MRTIKVNARCKDMCDLKLTDSDGTIKECSGYVPNLLGEGDYVELTIDIDTGKIVGWQVPTEEDLKDIFGPYEE